VSEQFFDAFFQFLDQSRNDPDPARDVRSEEYRFLTFAGNFLSLSKAQLFQDLWVLYETGAKEGGYFVEFGASDGLYLSNTLLLERHFGWQGALCEPNPLWHAELRRNRSAYISGACIAERSGEIVAFNQTPKPEFATIERYADADHHRDSRRGGTIIGVETLSLADFLKAAKAPARIDYLSIDTEGSEFDILANFDLQRYDIRLISVEHNFADQRQPLFDLLTRAGYRRKFERFSQWDDWYVRDETGEG
jgi:FkbM family methyltransferase